MNTRGIFHPNVKMGQALLESRDVGLSRIEITYTNATKQDENTVLSPLFHQDAEKDLDNAQLALQSVEGLCWHLPLYKLLSTFDQMVRGHQLLIVQQNSAALVFASNQKPGCFTGFFQPGPAKRRFNFLEFIKT